MPVKLIQATPSAYAYPLLIKQLLHTPLATAPDQEISYQGRVRYTYREFNQRLGRLANALAGLGLESGQTVAVMDWDSHRYLECFFAVPMMGGDPADRERAPVGRADPVHAESRASRCAAHQQRILPAAGADCRAPDDRAAFRADQRRGTSARGAGGADHRIRSHARCRRAGL